MMAETRIDISEPQFSDLDLSHLEEILDEEIVQTEYIDDESGVVITSDLPVAKQYIAKHKMFYYSLFILTLVIICLCSVGIMIFEQSSIEEKILYYISIFGVFVGFICLATVGSILQYYRFTDEH